MVFPPMLAVLVALFGVLWTRPLAAQGAVISGLVLVDSLERPIPGAEVELLGTSYRTRSDSSGAFALRGLPTGPYRLQVRAIGYAPLSLALTLSAEGLEGVDVLMRPSTQELERVDVRANLTPTARHLLDFESRRKFGIGKFLDSTALWRFGDQRQWAQAIVSQVPGIRSMSYGSSAALASGRGPTSAMALPRGDPMDIARGAKGACYMRVFVDGMLRYNSTRGEPLFDVTNYDGPPIVAAEVYSPGQLPAEFNRLGTASCGAILLWTRR